MTEYERIYGMLIGCAVGDAMGMPVEMWSQRRILAKYGYIDSFLPGDPDNAISAGLHAYETTDDTIITTIVAEMLIETAGRPDPLDLVRRIERWADNHPKRQKIIGPSTRRAFDRLANGVSVEEIGRYGDTNGSAMRISPVGAILSLNGDLTALVEMVSTVCKPTHNTSAAISGACAVAAAVSHGIAGAALSTMPESAQMAARAGETRGFDVCSASVAERIVFAIQLANNCLTDECFMEKLYALVGCGLLVTETVPSAIAIALRSQGDVLRCARLCANIGGDTDTLGAISCAIVGAHTGAGSIPASVAEKIQEVNYYDFQALAKKLFALRSSLA